MRTHFNLLLPMKLPVWRFLRQWLGNTQLDNVKTLTLDLRKLLQQCGHCPNRRLEDLLRRRSTHQPRPSVVKLSKMPSLRGGAKLFRREMWWHLTISDLVKCSRSTGRGGDSRSPGTMSRGQTMLDTVSRSTSSRRRCNDSPAATALDKDGTL